MDTRTIDTKKIEAFEERMVGVLNDGALALMCSLGHRTGLFDTMAELPPSTSQQIAQAAGLHERYVREWLNAMVVSQVVDYDPIPGYYTLAPEHAALLTRSVGADNIGLYTQYMGVLGSVEDQIVNCFFDGGGVPYSEFTRFHEVMAEDSGVNIVEPLLEDILPLVPGLVEKLEDGINVLDVGCGRGNALKRMAQAFPNSEFTGIDFSEETINVAKEDARKLGLTNLRFRVQDAARFDEANQYDLITTFDAVHDQAQPDRVLHNIARALKPDGVYLMQDISASSHVHNNLDNPLAPFLYTISAMHCMTVSLAYGGAGLGTMWGQEKALDMLKMAGFSSTQVTKLPHDIMNDYYISTKV